MLEEKVNTRSSVGADYDPSAHPKAKIDAIEPLGEMKAVTRRKMTVREHEGLRS